MICKTIQTMKVIASFMYKNNELKTNMIYIEKQRTTAVLQAPDIGQAYTECGGDKLVCRCYINKGNSSIPLFKLINPWTKNKIGVTN